MWTSNYQDLYEGPYLDSTAHYGLRLARSDWVTATSPIQGELRLRRKAIQVSCQLATVATSHHEYRKAKESNLRLFESTTRRFWARRVATQRGAAMKEV